MPQAPSEIYNEVKDAGIEVSDMSNTPLFAKTVSPHIVAKDGYNAMLQGKLDIIAGVTVPQKVMMSMLQFMPKKLMLKQIYQIQQ
ncbi:hypothetical protein [Clostridium sp. YIM B02555]|uniref:hypothetical protein n=1 Tax=Clostridium sp. YIM B02555 TaxID=2911968 RepID=UPI001EEF535F|nr:hypothetical protein [Clostridium sp. YIM B02555]